MKWWLILCLLLSGMSIAQSHYDLAKSLINSNGEWDKYLADFQKELDTQKELALEVYLTDLSGIELSDALIQARKQFEHEINQSSLYQIDTKGFEKAVVDRLLTEFSHEELIELNELYKNPLLSRMMGVQGQVKVTIANYLEAWQIENQKVKQHFDHKAQFLNELRIEYTKSQIEEFDNQADGDPIVLSKGE